MNCLSCGSGRYKSTTTANPNHIQNKCLNCGKSTRWVGTVVQCNHNKCKHCGRIIQHVEQMCFGNKGVCN